MKSRVHTALLVACISALVLTTFGQATNNFPFKGATGYFSPRRLAIPSHFDYIVVGTGPAGTLHTRSPFQGSRNDIFLRDCECALYAFHVTATAGLILILTFSGVFTSCSWHFDPSYLP